MKYDNMIELTLTKTKLEILVGSAGFTAVKYEFSCLDVNKHFNTHFNT